MNSKVARCAESSRCFSSLTYARYIATQTPAAVIATASACRITPTVATLVAYNMCLCLAPNTDEKSQMTKPVPSIVLSSLPQAKSPKTDEASQPRRSSARRIIVSRATFGQGQQIKSLLGRVRLPRRALHDAGRASSSAMARWRSKTPTSTTRAPPLKGGGWLAEGAARVVGRVAHGSRNARPTDACGTLPRAGPHRRP